MRRQEDGGGLELLATRHANTGLGSRLQQLPGDKCQEYTAQPLYTGETNKEGRSKTGLMRIERSENLHVEDFWGELVLCHRSIDRLRARACITHQLQR